MIEPMGVLGMIFSLLVLMLIGGFILLFPITRRLGAYLEQRLEQSNRGSDAAEVRQLRASLASVQAEVQRLAERQEFTDSLLSAPSIASGGALPQASGPDPSRSVPPGADA